METLLYKFAWARTAPESWTSLSGVIDLAMGKFTRPVVVLSPLHCAVGQGTTLEISRGAAEAAAS